MLDLKMERRMDLGKMVEGVVELDPMSGRMILRIPLEDGSFSFLDIQETLEQYKGEEVRFILTPLATISKIAEMIESGDLSVDEALEIKVPKH